MDGMTTATDAVTSSRKTTTNGKDSMNFAEWPLAVLVQPGKTRRHDSISFTDTVKHPKTGELVERSLTINPSAKYGHPTGPDADVLLGLIQLSRDADDRFTNPVVTFTRYQLLRLLKWRDEGWSYTRIDESIHRWKSITLTYKRAWWDVEKHDWVNLTFSPINDVKTYDKPRNPITIEWNKHVFTDFQRNIKPLNLDLYFSLQRTGSKQIYAYLDKHFHRPGRRTYDLREFATAHAGLSDKHNNSQLKRQLQRDITELEETDFLKPLSKTERYEQVRRGKWQVHFDKQRKNKKAKSEGKPTTNQSPLTQQLTARGVNLDVAGQLATKYADRVPLAVDVFDWHNKRGESKGSGYLVDSIRKHYYQSDTPEGFTAKADRARKTKAKQEQQAKENAEHARLHAQRDTRKALMTRMTPHWDKLSDDEKRDLTLATASTKFEQTRLLRKLPEPSYNALDELANRLGLKRADRAK